MEEFLSIWEDFLSSLEAPNCQRTAREVGSQSSLSHVHMGTAITP